MDRHQFEWRDEDDWLGSVEQLARRRVRITLCEVSENDTHSITHVVKPDIAMTLAFHTLRFASPDLPSAGEFWIVEADGKRRVVQVQDTPTEDTLREDVRFIARVPVEAQ